MFQALQKAGVSAELHLYDGGGMDLVSGPRVFRPPRGQNRQSAGCGLKGSCLNQTAWRRSVLPDR